MATATNSLISCNSVFAWIAAIACALLLIPLIAMQLKDSVNWSTADFAVMGALIFVAGSSFVLIARKVNPSRRLAVGALVLALFLYVWAELAVGVFTSLGS
ncbi:hypothetical protein [Thermomonas sp.]|jgi:hypothetical protein|uniref:hypothetical protein n=1 Tax=Thermomonas sp. TaxID=1971895 RepID=UPI00260E5B7F|nr:hypothetical protein [Thermomonas sp.]MCO5054568.1 hypothetical protein [Thermomonas sp.]